MKRINKTRSFIIDKSEDSPTWCWLRAEDIVTEITQRYHAKHIVITGGEPCLYDLVPLTDALEQAGCQCQIETSGTYTVRASENTWVTVSPKINMRGKLPVLASAMARGNEIKHPVGTEKDITQLETLLEACPASPGATIALQPVSQKTTRNPTVHRYLHCARLALISTDTQVFTYCLSHDSEHGDGINRAVME